MLEECTIGTDRRVAKKSSLTVSVVVRRMYYWDELHMNLAEDVLNVSVVVRRMYYWDADRDNYCLLLVASFSSC